MMPKALITFFFNLEGAPPSAISVAAPAMRQLRRGGAAGVRACERSLEARGVGSILDVFFVSFVKKQVLGLEGGVLVRPGDDPAVGVP